MAYVLSLCIPTFNGKDKLSYVLPILLENTDSEKIEICVSDNGSDDGTADYVESLLPFHENLKLHVFDDNMGFARNYGAALHMGTGKYHLLMGDDDIPYFANFGLLVDMIEQHWNYDVVLLKPYGFRSQFLPVDSNSHVLKGLDEFLGDYAVMATWISTYLFRHDVAMSYNLKNGNAFPHLEWLLANFGRLCIYYHAIPTMMESPISSCSYNRKLMDFFLEDLLELILPYEKRIEADVFSQYLKKIKGSILSFRSMLGYRARGCLSYKGIKRNINWINYYPLRLKLELYLLICIPSCILSSLYKIYRKMKLEKHLFT